MSSYGFSFNTSAVKNDEDDKYSVGVNFKDSDGYHFEAEESGTFQEIADALYQKFLTQYLVEAAKVKKEEEKQLNTATAQNTTPVQTDENLINRLRKLEQENARLRAENASAKYKDPSYNKPADKEPVIKTEAKKVADSAIDSLDRATEIMKKRLKADQDSALKDMFAYEPSDFVKRFLGMNMKKDFSFDKKAANDDDIWLW